MLPRRDLVPRLERRALTAITRDNILERVDADHTFNQHSEVVGPTLNSTLIGKGMR